MKTVNFCVETMTNRPKYVLNNTFKHPALLVARLVCIALLTALMVACASAPPSKTLPQSKVAVSSIDHKNYRKHTGNDVDAVKAKLKQAEAFQAEKQHENAEQLAQQILVDVELIQIRTQRMNVEAEVNQIESGITNLDEELEWRKPIQIKPLNQ